MTNFTSKLCLVSKKACLCWRSSKTKAWRPKINAARRRIPLLICYGKKRVFSISPSTKCSRKREPFHSNDTTTAWKANTKEKLPFGSCVSKILTPTAKNIDFHEKNRIVFAGKCIKCYVNILCAFQKRRSMLLAIFTLIHYLKIRLL